MSSFWDLVQAYRDETGASEAWIMRRAGLNKGTFTAWRNRGIPRLPEHDQLVALADTLRVEYTTLLDAILHDTHYLPERAARQQAEYAAPLREEFWQQVRDVAAAARAAAGADPQKAHMWMVMNIDAPTVVKAKATGLIMGRIPPDAPTWVSEVFDTPVDLPAAANQGELEGSGENSI